MTCTLRTPHVRGTCLLLIWLMFLNPCRQRLRGCPVFLLTDADGAVKPIYGWGVGGLVADVPEGGILAQYHRWRRQQIIAHPGGLLHCVTSSRQELRTSQDHCIEHQRQGDDMGQGAALPPRSCRSPSARQKNTDHR